MDILVKEFTMPKFTRVLSIDGGGIRGIIPGQVLVALEDKLNKAKKGARIADYFDLIAGTSTGGILACVYLCPARRGSTKPAFSAEQAVELYLERGDEIFDVPLLHRIRSAGSIRDEKYPADGLEDALKDYLKDLKLSELLKPCLVTSYDIRRRRCHFFRQHKAAAKESYNFLLRDVARATSAAPTYFEVPRVKSQTDIPYPCGRWRGFRQQSSAMRLCGGAREFARQTAGGGDGGSVNRDG